jgi:signal peptidase II
MEHLSDKSELKKIRKLIALMLMIAIFSLILILDLIAKHFMVGIDKDVIPGFFKFLYVENSGAAWSIFSGSGIALIVVSILAIILIVLYSIFSRTESKLLYISLGFVLGGALGNLVDRIVLGYVRDFIKLEFINFPIFNIADMMLTVGIIILSISFVILAVKDSKEIKEKK